MPACFQTLPFLKNKEYRKDDKEKSDKVNDKEKSDKVIPFELFFEVKYGEKAEYNKCDDFLYGFKLCRVIYVTAYSVCRNLKTVFKKCYSPAY